jgi:hypothetical protein
MRIRSGGRGAGSKQRQSGCPDLRRFKIIRGPGRAARFEGRILRYNASVRRPRASSVAPIGACPDRGRDRRLVRVQEGAMTDRRQYIALRCYATSKRRVSKTETLRLHATALSREPGGLPYQTRSAAAPLPPDEGCGMTAWRAWEKQIPRFARNDSVGRESRLRKRPPTSAAGADLEAGATMRFRGAGRADQ